MAPVSLTNRARRATAAAALLALYACAAPGPPPPAPPPAPPRAPPPAPPDVVDASGRMIVEAMEYPWSALGRLNTGGRGFCTGALVGPRLVLATARCLYNALEGRWWRPGELHFVAGYQRDRAILGSAVAAVEVAPGFAPGAGATLGNALNDWSLVTLRAPVGRRAGWLAVDRLDGAALGRIERGEAVAVQAGYRRDWAHAITLKLACADGRPLRPGTGGTAGCAASPAEAALPFLVLRAGGPAVLTGADLAARSGPAPGTAARAPDPGGPAATVPRDTVRRLLQHLGRSGRAEPTLALLGRLIAQVQGEFQRIGERRPRMVAGAL